jgi:transposase
VLVNTSLKHQYFQGFQRILFVSSGMQSEEQISDYIQISRQEYNQFLQLRKDAESLQIQLNQARMDQILMAQELANLKRMIFGAKSERHIGEDPSQLALNLGFDKVPGVGPQKEEVAYTRNKSAKKGHARESIPAHLPREEQVILPEEDVTGMEQIGQAVHEHLAYKPGRLYVVKQTRPKFLDRETGKIIIADLPTLPIPSSNAGPSLLAHIVVSKYMDHLPLYRQSQIFKREQDIHLAESTLNDWFSATCRLLEPLYDVLQREVQGSHYLQADETPIPVQTQDKPGATHKGYLWVYHSPPDQMVVFDYNKSRSREEPGEFLKSFQGALQCDGYQAYDAYEKTDGITLLACWAHARRKFEQSLDNDKLRSEYAMEKIRQLYLIEREAEEMNAGQRKTLRQDKSVPVLQELKAWMMNQLNDVLPKSPIGKAIQYTLGLWDRLERYTQDGTWLIDNNRIESSIRPVALGRKNYLFAGSHDAAQRAAMMYSLLGTCKMNGINPWQWLNHVLTVIPDWKANRLEELLPLANWEEKA